MCVAAWAWTWSFETSVRLPWANSIHRNLDLEPTSPPSGPSTVQMIKSWASRALQVMYVGIHCLSTEERAQQGASGSDAVGHDDRWHWRRAAHVWRQRGGGKTEKRRSPVSMALEKSTARTSGSRGREQTIISLLFRNSEMRWTRRSLPAASSAQGMHFFIHILPQKCHREFWVFEWA